MVDDLPTDAEIRFVTDGFRMIVDNVASFIKGKPRVIELTTVCLLARGHLLIDDVPGTGKTSLAKALSGSVDGSVRRVQFTPDLLPSDVTGVMIYDQAAHQFEFHPGPVFANIVLGDEINRASPKTQSALLEVMEEGRVTVDGRPYPVPEPFFVMATENPIELSGTYELPEAQKDRFMMKMSIGYPDQASEAEILADQQSPDDLRPVVNLADLSRMIDIAGRVYVAPQIRQFIVAVAAATRTMSEVSLGASVRASKSLRNAARAYAATRSRNYVTVDDVKALAYVVLCHRLMVRPEAELNGYTADKLLGSVLDAIPVSIDVPNR